MIPSELIGNLVAKAAFANLVTLCAAEPEFVAQFNRLTGCNFGYSGENEQDMIAFVAFVFEYVWSRLSQTEAQS